MKPIRIFRHNDWIEAGYFAETLKRNNIEFDLIAIDQNETVPKIVEDVSGLAFLGGTSSVNDSFSWIEDELALIRIAAEQKMPVFGHCFGAQLISKALGGNVFKMPAKEIGWHAVKFSDNIITTEWFSYIPNSINVMLWHEDAMVIPQGATPLFSTQFSQGQGVAIDNMIATIPHIEVTSRMLAKWLGIYGDDLALLSASVQSIEQVSYNCDERIAKM